MRAVAGALSPCEPKKTRLGFIGMGILGVPMTKRLLAAGYDVSVYNRTRDKCLEVGPGAKICSSPKEVVEASDITFATLSDPEAALEVALGTHGVVEGICPGKGYIDVSTVDPACSLKISEAIVAKGGLFLEAPVSGSKGPAEQGKLIFLTAGSNELFEAAAPALDVMGKARHFLGPEVGKGAKMKLVVNQVMGVMMVGWAEGMVLAEKSDLKASDLIQIVSEGAIACPMYALKGPLMAQDSFAPAFPLKHQQKDLRLALELAASVGADMPTTSAANQVYVGALEECGDLDFSSVIKKLK